MKKVIIITGHGNYATGVLSSLEMIAGPNEYINAIDFDGNNDVASIYSDIIKEHQNDNILFVCDLLGGTPFKEASKIAFNNPNIEVVVGCNVGSLLELILIKDNYNLKDLVSKIIESSKKNTMYLDKTKIKVKEEVNNDGI
jgi:PTS system N-acetylgalactosamine-specific IIA component